MKQKLTVIYYDLEGNLSEEILSGNLTSSGNFLIQEIPLFAPNLALGDMVSVETEDGNLFFERLIKASGNTTIHIVILDECSDDLLGQIAKIGGTVRKWNSTYFSVNIPPFKYDIDLKNMLNYYESMNILSYKEACLGMPD